MAGEITRLDCCSTSGMPSRLRSAPKTTAPPLIAAAATGVGPTVVKAAGAEYTVDGGAMYVGSEVVTVGARLTGAAVVTTGAAVVTTGAAVVTTGAAAGIVRLAPRTGAGAAYAGAPTVTGPPRGVGACMIFGGTGKGAGIGGDTKDAPGIMGGADMERPGRGCWRTSGIPSRFLSTPLTNMFGRPSWFKSTPATAIGEPGNDCPIPLVVNPGATKDCPTAAFVIGGTAKDIPTPLPVSGGTASEAVGGDM